MDKENKFIRSGPHLPVKDLKATLEYYREQLGFSDDWIFGSTDGGICRDDIRLLFNENPNYVSQINEQGYRLPLIWFVEHIESVFAEFKEKKIALADTLQEHSYGSKEFAFIDINGYYIRVSEVNKNNDL